MLNKGHSLAAGSRNFANHLKHGHLFLPGFPFLVPGLHVTQRTLRVERSRGESEGDHSILPGADAQAECRQPGETYFGIAAISVRQNK